MYRKWLTQFFCYLYVSAIAVWWGDRDVPIVLGLPEANSAKALWDIAKAIAFTNTLKILTLAVQYFVIPQLRANSVDAAERFQKLHYDFEAILKIHLIFELLKNPVVIGILTLASTVAAVIAAYFSWKQLHLQRSRWATEEARSKPIIFLAASPYCTEEKLIHGVWGVNSRVSFQLELLTIEAVNPRTLRIGDLDPTTDGSVPKMKPVSLGREINVVEVLPIYPNQIGRNFLFRISDNPEQDKGKRVRMRFTFREVDNPHLICKLDATFEVPALKRYEI